MAEQEDNDGKEIDEQPEGGENEVFEEWSPQAGWLAKIFVWVVLAIIAIVVLGMIFAIFD